MNDDIKRLQEEYYATLNLTPNTSREAKRKEIKGIKAARKTDKAFAKTEKLRQIGHTGGLRGKIAEKRSDRIDERMRTNKGKYGRWDSKLGEGYYAEGFEDRGGYKQQNISHRDDLIKDIIDEKTQVSDEGKPETVIPNYQLNPGDGSDSVVAGFNEEGGEGSGDGENNEPEGDFAGGS